MNDWICPNCGRHLTGVSDKTHAVACGNCGEVVKRDDLLPAEGKNSPTLRFLGNGWTPKGGKCGG